MVEGEQVRSGDKRDKLLEDAITRTKNASVTLFEKARLLHKMARVLRTAVEEAMENGASQKHIFEEVVWEDVRTVPAFFFAFLQSADLQ